MRLLLSTMAAIAIAALTVGAETATISAASVEAAPKGSAAVAIDISGARGFRAMHVEVAYDASVLSVERIDAGPLLQGALLEPDAQAQGLIRLKIAARNAIGGDGNLATIHFKVLSQGEARSGIEVRNCEMYAPGEGGELIVVQSIPGQVSVKGGVAITTWIIGGAFLLIFGLLVSRPALAKWRVRPAAAGPCAKCGAPLAGGTRFCPKCGSARP